MPCYTGDMNRPGRSAPRRAFVNLPSDAGPGLYRLPRDYISFTIDTSLLLGGYWWGPSRSMKDGVSTDRAAPLDLAQDKLVAYAKALSPATLRIGGTEADHVRYKSGAKAVRALGMEASTEERPDAAVPVHRYAMGKGLWKRIHRFVGRARLKLLFTVSAGPSDRDEAGVWLDGNLRKLVAYSRRKGLSVAVWELGNEVNGFPFIYGLKHRVGPGRYGRDFARFAALLKDLEPESLLAGPSSAVWPRVGEPNPLIPGFCASAAAAFLDVVTWHYYPQQSSRGKIAVLRCDEGTMLKPRNLDAVRKAARRIRKSVERAKRCRPSHRPVRNWVTETAHALYGGEPGLSDTFASTLWWLDELGVLAQEGVSKVFRQSLIGSDYGLLSQEEIRPRPDYYAALLWKRFMGRRVLDPKELVEDADPYLRVYIHGDGKGALSILGVNIHRRRASRLMLRPAPGTDGSAFASAERLILCGHGGFTSRILSVNGVSAEEDLIFAPEAEETMGKYRIRALSQEETAGRYEIPPLAALLLRIDTGTPGRQA